MSHKNHAVPCGTTWLKVGNGIVICSEGLNIGPSAENTWCGGKTLQGIVSKAQRVAHSGFVGSQQACGFTVSVGFRIIGASQLPVLCGQLVIGIVGLPGSDDIAGRVFDGAGHQTALGIVAVLIGQACLAVLYGIELP